VIGRGEDRAQRVVVVDGGDATAEAVAEGLAAAGPPTHVAAIPTLAEALAVVEGASCVVLSLDLPDASGLGALCKIRAAHPTVPVVVLAGDDESGLEAVRAGAQDYLTDLHPATMRHAVRCAVHRARGDGLRDVEGRALELLAADAEPGIVLGELASLVDRYVVGVRTAVLVLEGGALHVVAAPSLTDTQIRAIEGSRPGHGVRPTPSVAGGSCWSVPIRGGEGEALGAMALYASEGYRLTLDEQHLVERTAHLAAVVLERSATQQQLAHLALHDQLTDLPNRTLLTDRLALALARARRAATGVALLFLDLDRFKEVNDTLGHDAGDELLVQVAERVRGAIRPTDTLSRFGGDEFVLLCEDIADRADAERVAVRVSAAFRTPFPLAGREVTVGLSIGIALAGGDTDPDELLREADAAMYRAKRRGRGRFELHDISRTADRREREESEREVLAAAARGQLRLVFQPIVDLHAGGLAGVEALVRWAHPRRGLLEPAEFLGLAAEAGALPAIDHWVVREACRQAQAWQHAEPDRPPITICVNLASETLSRPDVVETIAAALADHGLTPATLAVEVPESALVGGGEHVVAALEALRVVGVHVTLDGYSGGFASLDRLQHLPVDAVKIDPSFVAGLADGPRGRALLVAAVGLSHAFGLVVVAQGVETADQLQAVTELGCDCAQGWHLARPSGPAVVIDLIAAERMIAPV
jgi:diguanylate cyclase (GGDEF)-like protein